jgi:SNF2 family DNA or RNA helicase
MIVLHASYCDNTLLLWGEDSDDESRLVRGETRPRAVDPAAPRPYPYNAGRALAQELRTSLPDLKLSTGKFHEAVAWLPTTGNTPIPSSPLIADVVVGRGKLKLAPWTVTVYSLSPAEAVGFLSHCAGQRTLGAGVIVGTDLSCWAECLRYAGSLVARQQYLPGVVLDGPEYWAVWQPLWAGDEAARLAGLARRLPAVARAISAPGAAAPPQTPAPVIVKQFIGAFTDYLVRSAAREGPPRGAGARRSVSSFDSIHDAWLHGLRSPDGVLQGDRNELVRLATQVRDWRRPIAVAANSPFRICFRLEEPTTVEEPQPALESRERPRMAQPDQWYLRYLLQPHDDPSLLLPLGEIWKVKGAQSSVLQKHGANAREYLLASLGQAAGVCPAIAASLETAQPQGCLLDTPGAHHFLTQEAAVLEQAGFGVMLPSWWTRKGTKNKLVARANVRSPRMQGGGVSLESMVQFDWEVALGDDPLTLEELESLAELKISLVQVRGQWVELNPTEIQAAIDFWKKQGSGQLTVRDMVQMALGVGDAGSPLEVEGVKAGGWAGKLLEQLEGNAALEELPPPGSLSGTLRPYQVRGYSWLAFLRQWGLGGCLADDMGLGKTIQTLALVQRDWEARSEGPVLLVCPTSVVTNWQKEAARFTPQLPVLVHHGMGRKKGDAFQKEVRRHALVICSYGLLQRDIRFLQEVDWAGVVLDEAQNIKNPETRQARAARSLRADYRISLTGTPVENNVGDLWSIMEFLNPGFLGSQAEFKRNFFLPIQTRRDPEAAQRLQRITRPFILRRLKTDKTIISDLPEKQEMKLFCTLTREQASLYAAVLQETQQTLEEAEGIQRRGLVLGTLSKLKQVCNHPAHFLGDNSSVPGRSGKLTRLEEMLEEIIEVGERALVFSQFSEMGDILRRHLQQTLGREVLFLHGGLPRRQRDRMVERFENEPDGPPIFILSVKAGGTGLNLTRANHVFHFDRWWNPAVENQATDRAFRIGQTRNVQVHKFVCAGTLEEKIDEMIESKIEVAEKVIGAGEGWLTELSNQELREIFALRPEAVSEVVEV